MEDNRRCDAGLSKLRRNKGDLRKQKRLTAKKISGRRS